MRRIENASPSPHTPHTSLRFFTNSGGMNSRFF
jgi:hypothetical protein